MAQEDGPPDEDGDPWAGYEAPTRKDHPLPQDRGTEDEFRKSEALGAPHYGYVAIAIGNWANRGSNPKHRPEWAIAECKKLSENARIATRRVLSPANPPPKVDLRDGELLERIADFLTSSNARKRAGYSGKITSRAIIRFLLDVSDALDGADVKKMQRLWRHAKNERIAEAGFRRLTEALAFGLKTRPDD